MHHPHLLTTALMLSCLVAGVGHAAQPAGQPAGPGQNTPAPRLAQMAPSHTGPAPQATLETDAAQCLAWYRPWLRDPLGAYYARPVRDQRVVSIDLYATGELGGFEIRRASCEFEGGKILETGTRELARRAGWTVR